MSALSAIGERAAILRELRFVFLGEESKNPSPAGHRPSVSGVSIEMRRKSVHEHRRSTIQLADRFGISGPSLQAEMNRLREMSSDFPSAYATKYREMIRVLNQFKILASDAVQTLVGFCIENDAEISALAEAHMHGVHLVLLGDPLGLGFPSDHPQPAKVAHREVAGRGDLFALSHLDGTLQVPLAAVVSYAGLSFFAEVDLGLRSQETMLSGIPRPATEQFERRSGAEGAMPWNRTAEYVSRAMGMSMGLRSRTSGGAQAFLPVEVRTDVSTDGVYYVQSLARTRLPLLEDAEQPCRRPPPWSPAPSSPCFGLREMGEFRLLPALVLTHGSPIGHQPDTWVGDGKRALDNGDAEVLALNHRLHDIALPKLANFLILLDYAMRGQIVTEEELGEALGFNVANFTSNLQDRAAEADNSELLTETHRRLIVLSSPREMLRLTCTKLKALFHSFGVNMRLLGRVTERVEAALTEGLRFHKLGLTAAQQGLLSPQNSPVRGAATLPNDLGVTPKDAVDASLPAVDAAAVNAPEFVAKFPVLKIIRIEMAARATAEALRALWAARNVARLLRQPERVEASRFVPMRHPTLDGTKDAPDEEKGAGARGGGKVGRRSDAYFQGKVEQDVPGSSSSGAKARPASPPRTGAGARRSFDLGPRVQASRGRLNLAAATEHLEAATLDFLVRVSGDFLSHIDDYDRKTWDAEVIPRLRRKFGYDWHFSREHKSTSNVMGGTKNHLSTGSRLRSRHQVPSGDEQWSAAHLCPAGKARSLCAQPSTAWGTMDGDASSTRSPHRAGGSGPSPSQFTVAVAAAGPRVPLDAMGIDHVLDPDVGAAAFQLLRAAATGVEEDPRHGAAQRPLTQEQRQAAFNKYRRHVELLHIATVAEAFEMTIDNDHPFGAYEHVFEDADTEVRIGEKQDYRLVQRVCELCGIVLSTGSRSVSGVSLDMTPVARSFRIEMPFSPSDLLHIDRGDGDVALERITRRLRATKRFWGPPSAEYRCIPDTLRCAEVLRLQAKHHASSEAFKRVVDVLLHENGHNHLGAIDANIRASRALLSARVERTAVQFAQHAVSIATEYSAPRSKLLIRALFSLLDLLETINGGTAAFTKNKIDIALRLQNLCAETGTMSLSRVEARASLLQLTHAVQRLQQKIDENEVTRVKIEEDARREEARIRAAMSLSESPRSPRMGASPDLLAHQARRSQRAIPVLHNIDLSKREVTEAEHNLSTSIGAVLLDQGADDELTYFVARYVEHTKRVELMPLLCAATTTYVHVTSPYYGPCMDIVTALISTTIASMQTPKDQSGDAETGPDGIAAGRRATQKTNPAAPSQGGKRERTVQIVVDLPDANELSSGSSSDSDQPSTTQGGTSGGSGASSIRRVAGRGSIHGSLAKKSVSVAEGGGDEKVDVVDPYPIELFFELFTNPKWADETAYDICAAQESLHVYMVVEKSILSSLSRARSSAALWKSMAKMNTKRGYSSRQPLLASDDDMDSGNGPDFGRQNSSSHNYESASEGGSGEDSPTNASFSSSHRSSGTSLHSEPARKPVCIPHAVQLRITMTAAAVTLRRWFKGILQCIPSDKREMPWAWDGKAVHQPYCALVSRVSDMCIENPEIGFRCCIALIAECHVPSERRQARPRNQNLSIFSAREREAVKFALSDPMLADLGIQRHNPLRDEPPPPTGAAPAYTPLALPFLYFMAKLLWDVAAGAMVHRGHTVAPLRSPFILDEEPRRLPAFENQLELLTFHTAVMRLLQCLRTIYALDIPEVIVSGYAPPPDEPEAGAATSAADAATTPTADQGVPLNFGGRVPTCLSKVLLILFKGLRFLDFPKLLEGDEQSSAGGEKSSALHKKSMRVDSPDARHRRVSLSRPSELRQLRARDHTQPLSRTTCMGLIDALSWRMGTLQAGALLPSGAPAPPAPGAERLLALLRAKESLPTAVALAYTMPLAAVFHTLKLQTYFPAAALLEQIGAKYPLQREPLWHAFAAAVQQLMTEEERLYVPRYSAQTLQRSPVQLLELYRSASLLVNITRRHLGALRGQATIEARLLSLRERLGGGSALVAALQVKRQAQEERRRAGFAEQLEVQIIGDDMPSDVDGDDLAAVERCPLVGVGAVRAHATHPSLLQQAVVPGETLAAEGGVLTPVDRALPPQNQKRVGGGNSAVVTVVKSTALSQGRAAKHLMPHPSRSPNHGAPKGTSKDTTASSPARVGASPSTEAAMTIPLGLHVRGAGLPGAPFTVEWAIPIQAPPRDAVLAMFLISTTTSTHPSVGARGHAYTTHGTMNDTMTSASSAEAMTSARRQPVVVSGGVPQWHLREAVHVTRGFHVRKHQGSVALVAPKVIGIYQMALFHEGKSPILVSDTFVISLEM